MISAGLRIACLLALCACSPERMTEATEGAAPVVRDREARAASMPLSRDGADLVGTNVSALLPTRWIGESVVSSGPRAARATLIRFWTDTCPYCSASLPAVERLRNEHAAGGLATVGVYHPKPPRSVSDDDVRQAARRLGYEGPVAVDSDWAALRAIWLDSGRRAATSFSVLCDREGVVRFVHPGPEFHPSDDEAHARCDGDYRDLEAAIEVLLTE